MKSLILAAACILPLGANCALAESGDTFEWATPSTVPTAAVQATATQKPTRTAGLLTKNNLADRESPVDLVFGANG